MNTPHQNLAQISRRYQDALADGNWPEARYAWQWYRPDETSDFDRVDELVESMAEALRAGLFEKVRHCSNQANSRLAGYRQPEIDQLIEAIREPEACARRAAAAESDQDYQAAIAIWQELVASGRWAVPELGERCRTLAIRSQIHDFEKANDALSKALLATGAPAKGKSNPSERLLRMAEQCYRSIDPGRLQGYVALEEQYLAAVLTLVGLCLKVADVDGPKRDLAILDLAGRILQQCEADNLSPQSDHLKRMLYNLTTEQLSLHSFVVAEAVCALARKGEFGKAVQLLAGLAADARLTSLDVWPTASQFLDELAAMDDRATAAKEQLAALDFDAALQAITVEEELSGGIASFGQSRALQPGELLKRYCHPRCRTQRAARGDLGSRCPNPCDPDCGRELRQESDYTNRMLAQITQNAERVAQRREMQRRLIEQVVDFDRRRKRWAAWRAAAKLRRYVERGFTRDLFTEDEIATCRMEAAQLVDECWRRFLADLLTLRLFLRWPFR